ncbi:glycosyltransferase [Snodgrassella alvi]|uniref:glycosyltransferase n=1 Tax=Snodgrassella alvi TaxID=1196083 RepID=UPI003519D8AA
MVSISIIVPVYNVEKYLYTCLESIKNQSFTDFEVFCINDGSTDDSLKIINQFVKLDKRFKLINKKNSGYGHTINLGLNQCFGKYIAIIESDDYIEHNMMNKLFDLAEKYSLDVARCNYYKFSDKNRKKEDLSYIIADKVIKPLDYPQIFYQAPAIWANLYNCDFLKKNKIFFLETAGAAYQDVSFAFKVNALCEKLMFIDQPLLNYRIDNINSSVNSKDKVNCVCDEYKEILNFLKQNPTIYKRIKFHLPLLRYNCYKWNYSRIARKYKFSFLKQWQKDTKKDFIEQRINLKYLKWKQLINILIIIYLPIFYRWFK